MSEYVTLLGTEQVQSAAYAMRDAGTEMQRAASNIEDSFCRALRNFESLVERLEVLADKEEKLWARN